MLENLTKTNELLNYCKKVAGHYGPDLLQECYLIMLQHPEAENINMAYAKRICLYQFIHPRSQFKKKYILKPICKISLEAINEATNNEYIDFIKEILNEPGETKRDNFINDVFNEYLKTGSTRKLSEQTGICRNTLNKAKNKFINKAKIKINERIKINS